MNMKLKDKLHSKRSSNYSSSFYQKDELIDVVNVNIIGTATAANTVKQYGSNLQGYMRGSQIHTQIDSPLEVNKIDNSKYNSQSVLLQIKKENSMNNNLNPNNSKIKQI